MKTQLKAFYRTQLNSVYKNSLTALRPAIAIPALVMSLAAPVYAQENGAATGVVSSGDGTFFYEGARVIIPELGRETTTGRDGRYRFTNLPPGEYTVRVEYLGAEPMQLGVTVSAGETSTTNIAFASQVEEVLLVVGSRAGLTSARNKERIADELKNVVASDSIGSFPDQNIAESLQRLPGVSIERDAGEGKFVTVRGLRAEFTNVEIDGVKVGGGEGGDVDGGGTSRNVRLDILSSDILEGIEVIKTPTAEMEGDAVGATVSLNTLSAFDRGGRSVKFRLEGSEQDIIEETNFKGTLAYTDIFDFSAGELGIALALTAQERDIARTQVETNDSPFVQAAVDADGNTIEPGEGDEIFLIPDRIRDVYRVNKRDRTGITLNLDYRPNDDNEFYLRLSRNETKQDTFRVRNRYDLGGRIDDDPGELDDADEVFDLGPYTAAIDDADIRKQIRTGEFEDETNVYSIGGLNRFDSWTVDYKLGLSETKDGQTKPSIATRWRARDILVRYDASSDSARVEATALDGEDDPFNPADYSLNQVLVNQNNNEDDITSFAFNAEYEFGNDNALKFGIKSTLRDRKFTLLDEDITDEIEDAGLFGESLQDFVDLGVSLREYDFLAGVSALSFIPADGPYDSIINANRAFIEQTAIENEAPGSGFDMSEDVLAAYVQLTYNITDTLRVVGGVRVEQTEFDSGSGFFNESIEYSDASAIPDAEQLDGREFEVGGFSTDYTDVLPRVMFRWEPMDELILRFAYTTAVQRPDFDTISPSASISTSELEDDNDIGLGTFRRVINNAGSSDLEPAQSDQWDLYLTWYPNDDSVLQAGLFLKNISDFFSTTTLVGDDVTRAGFEPNTDGSIDGGFDIVSGITLNGDDAEVSGVELSYQQNFDFGGFVTASWTTVDSEASYGEVRPNEELPLIGQADNLGSISLGWENEQWTVKVATTYQDDSFFKIASASFAEQDGFIESASYTDIGVKYNINDNFTIYADAINVFGEERIKAFPGLQQPWFEEVEDFGTTYQIGVTGTF